MKSARRFGNHGRLLKIDLTNQDIRTENLSENDLRLFMGGRGLGAAIMLRELPAGIDPLGEENLLIFSAGPLVDTSVPGSNRYSLHTKRSSSNYATERSLTSSWSLAAVNPAGAVVAPAYVLTVVAQNPIISEVVVYHLVPMNAANVSDSLE